jgi:hypothetical protein
MPGGKLMSSCRVLVATIAVLLGVGAQNAAGDEKGNSAAKGDTGFSFVAYGDSRPMMYLPVKAGQPDLVKLFTEIFGLVMPEKIAEEVVKRDVKLIYDPDSNELIRVIMPFVTKTEVMTLTIDQGWVTEASVEDVKLLPGVHRTMFRLGGGEWVARGRKGGPVRSRPIRREQRRCRLVGQSRPHGRRQPLLEAPERHHAEATAAAGQRDARGRAGREVVPGSRQSRGVGRSQYRRRAQRRAVSQKIGCHAAESAL